MKKMAYFDMDGTIANFYGVDGWLDCLMAHDPRPYAVAEPLFTAEQFAKIVQILQAQGFGIGIISWCSKENPQGKKRMACKVLPLRGRNSCNCLRCPQVVDCPP